MASNSLSDIFQLVKEKDFIEIFQTYEPRKRLRSIQKGYLTNCPFHADRKPSFAIYRDGFKCFSCGEYGDAVDFVVKLTGQRPITAAREIAGIYGLDPSKVTVKQRARLTEARRKQRLETAFRKWERVTFARLVGFRDTIQKMMDLYGLDAPEPILKIYRDYWPQLNYYIETLACGRDEDKLVLFRWRVFE